MKWQLTNADEDLFPHGRVRLTIETDSELALEVLEFARNLYEERQRAEERRAFEALFGRVR